MNTVELLEKLYTINQAPKEYRMSRRSGGYRRVKEAIEVGFVTFKRSENHFQITYDIYKALTFLGLRKGKEKQYRKYRMIENSYRTNTLYIKSFVRNETIDEILN